LSAGVKKLLTLLLALFLLIPAAAPAQNTAPASAPTAPATAPAATPTPAPAPSPAPFDFRKELAAALQANEAAQFAFLDRVIAAGTLSEEHRALLKAWSNSEIFKPTTAGDTTGDDATDDDSIRHSSFVIRHSSFVIRHSLDFIYLLHLKIRLD